MESAIITNWFEDLYATEKRAVLKIQTEHNLTCGEGLKLYHPTMYSSAVDFFLDAMSVPS
tara:strand:+ start:86 stop:265 length:180 start_codon:yes stop_codon:yes gene_type:complete